ncbi:hypothetical protein CMEL01_03062 [Colletotrichum melonis]|uniref:Uncharacterized protein n=1 Tax=Colletotrichum melonis TaxID=1209925 RepID=A0AAI9UKA9_9PEZI|nr:hypothetical protein CMEL01_03062 [Colletotrichum melonis]
MQESTTTTRGRTMKPATKVLVILSTTYRP